MTWLLGMLALSVLVSAGLLALAYRRDDVTAPASEADAEPSVPIEVQRERHRHHDRLLITSNRVIDSPEDAREWTAEVDEYLALEARMGRDPAGAELDRVLGTFIDVVDHAKDPTPEMLHHREGNRRARTLLAERIAVHEEADHRVEDGR